jgi:hypothetical protein
VAGVFVVTAAGNNFGNFPTHEIVYPARAGRVVAVCGVMADQIPYADVSINLLGGNYGPADKMQVAVAAYTPFRRRALVNRRSPIGMATARPLLRHKLLPLGRFGSKRIGKSTKGTRQGWQRVEAVRAALFEKAKIDANYQVFWAR